MMTVHRVGLGGMPGVSVSKSSQSGRLLQLAGGVPPSLVPDSLPGAASGFGDDSALASVGVEESSLVGPVFPSGLEVVPPSELLSAGLWEAGEAQAKRREMGRSRQAAKDVAVIVSEAKDLPVDVGGSSALRASE
jgi:hypothetical protein